MAKLSAHGGEIGRLEFIRFQKAYMVDGTILKNQGFGWKVYGKVKAGIDPNQAFKNAKEFQIKARLEHPAHAALSKALIEAACISKRWKLLTALEMMPDDPDGIWSEVSDGYGDNLDISIDEIAEICRLWKAAEQEKIYEETHKEGLPEG